jgi:hypothetical protein
MENLSRYRGLAAAALTGTCIIVAACVDTSPTATLPLKSANSTRALTQLVCTASTVSRSVSCETPKSVSLPDGSKGAILSGQNSSVKLTSSNVSYNSGTEIFQFDVTVQNLNNEAIGTPDGAVPDSDGIQVFFAEGPTVTSGSGTISVANPDGVGSFTNANQPYFAYHQILIKDQVSSARTWQLSVPSTATSFKFGLLIETDIQYLLVINEMLVNPGGTITDANGEWIEIYNAGNHSVNLQGLFIADSAASGRRPYAMIDDTTASLIIPSGGYFTLGDTKNTTNNGGVPIDYAYGATMAFANSLDAFKISRVYGTDTLTIDRTQYANAATSAQNGISRELKNPALDNSNMDGSNWADASVVSVYGPGGRGTPKAQNSTFTPDLISSEPGPLLGSLQVNSAQRRTDQPLRARK